MINTIATIVIASVSSRKSHVSSHLLVLKMCASGTNASAQTLTPLANSTFNNRVTQNGPLHMTYVLAQLWEI